MPSYFFKSLTRKKTLGDEGSSKLARVMTLFDLSALGVGSTLGLGVYMLAGKVAKEHAGPAACLSFLIAAIASAFAGLCYAEFAARVPRAGSAYVYSYVSIGEFVAFIIGWNLILEYAIGTASVARGMSGYIDFLIDKKMSNTMRNSSLHMDVDFLAPYPDFLSFGFVALLTVLLSIGVKESSKLNNVLTSLNLATVAVIIITGIVRAQPSYWSLTLDEIPEEYRSKAGTAGFAPFGFKGIMSGAALCFFGFVGFDAVATTGEEAKNPKKNIPLAIVISLSIIFFTYFGISTVLTLMSPYYDQDINAPFLYVFDKLELQAVKYVVSAGAIIALCTSLLGAMFPLPRVIYAMANDGLIFKFLARINVRTQTPLVATVVSGLLVGVMAVVFDTEQLMNMMSIGTLLAYTIVAVCVLILRYECRDGDYPITDDGKKIEVDVEKSMLVVFKEMFNLNMNKRPTRSSSRIIKWAVVLFSVFVAVFDAIIVYAISDLGEAPITTIFVIVTMVVVGLVVVIGRQPTDDIELNFKVPLVPVLPCLSILINLYLMLELDGQTWIRFLVWLIVGFVIYFSYGLFKSEEKLYRKEKSDQKGLESTISDTKF